MASLNEHAGHTVACFASSNYYVSGQLAERRECNVALRDMHAAFDSSGAAPELVITADVRIDGRDTTWQARYPFQLENDVVTVSPNAREWEALPQETRFITMPGTVVDGAVTLIGVTTTESFIVDNPYGTGPFTGTAYTTPERWVTIFTSNGSVPRHEPLGGKYVGYSFAGLPTSGVTCNAPDSCYSYTYASTLVRDGELWVFDFSMNLTGSMWGKGIGTSISNLAVTEAGAFVEFGVVPSGFVVTGSRVGSTLTLFPFYSWGPEYSPMPTPIILRAND